MRLLRYSEIMNIVARVDVVVEVVEARNPLETKSNIIEKLIKGMDKDYILALNKCDLIPKYICREWVEYFDSQNIKAICISSLKNIGIRKLKRMFLSYAKNRKPLNVAIFGIPKVGKSSLINALKGKQSAPTSPYPGTWGYTKGITIYKIAPGVYIFDTPGYVPPDKKNLEMIIRGRPIDLLENPIIIAKEILLKVLDANPKSIVKAYDTESSDPIEILRHIALKRGWLYKKDKEPNIEEAAKAVIRDYLDGKITFFSRPPTRNFLDS